MKKSILFMSLLSLSTIVFGSPINIQVLSATVKDQSINNAEVILQKNGETSSSTHTNVQGRASIESIIDNQDSLLIIKKEGYSTLVAKCPCDGLTYALSPVQTKLGSMRIVLTWGEKPLDLDSHLNYSNQHIYWSNKEGHQANLDVDDRDSYGPETITIDQRLSDQYYVYSVHDFSNRDEPGSNGLSHSQAKVMVYTGKSLIRSYEVPINKTGNLWTVFRISPTGEIQDINQISSVKVGAENIGSSVSNYQQEATRIAIVPVSAGNQARAKAINLKADILYKNNNYERAAIFYQQSIDLNPNVGQTYSNLAVTYQKLGRSSEALWANRKAITLATNDNVRAYSNYNIGRIYENNGEYERALEYYRLANRFKSSATYVEAIRRMEQR
ncbi:TPR repeat family protein [Acinetobacter baumannii 299505]|uniref:tetratricopeptide repeat protein n=2 Tax=Acinetobacter baumannii TaxID=470 RepID=UPI00044972F5|nr:tetratricopeptide repeat protein [Acinetobacter baumannii]EXB79978.1 TPR repeat family protein [Acinetobacter baumannii 299505]HCA5722787.1 tetratricopeptide repeat protein [Acinetobacter baumannii]